jgi:hypothetical protein
VRIGANQCFSVVTRVLQNNYIYNSFTNTLPENFKRLFNNLFASDGIVCRGDIIDSRGPYTIKQKKE